MPSADSGDTALANADSVDMNELATAGVGISLY
jgi:hypothetical protein